MSAPSAPGALRRAVAETAGGLPGSFWWLWTSTLVNRLGGFVVTFLALYLTAGRGYSATFAGLVASLYGLGCAVAAVVGGVLADRVGRRPTLLGAQLGTAVCTVLLGLAEGRAEIAVAALLLGLTSNASRPATSAIMADLVPPQDRVRAFSLNYWAINIGFGVSAAVAGLVAAHGYLLLFLGDAAATLLCALVVFAKVPETRPRAGAAPAAAAGGPGPGNGTGLGRVLADGPFMALVGLTFLVALVAQQGSTTLAVDMGAAGLSSTQYGLVIGLNGLLIVLLQIPVTRLVEGRSRAALLVVGALLTGWGFGLTAFAHGAAAYALTVAVWTVGEIVQAPTSMALVAEMSPAEARGRYQGVYSLSWSAASFAAPAAGGFLLDRAGGGAVWGACAVLGTAAAAGYALLVRGRRAQDPGPVPQPVRPVREVQEAPGAAPAVAGEAAAAGAAAAAGTAVG
ncbi:MFS transporter [Streptacidiphilus sp. ASG 303]|uniref:MDR family MFS transporter n=1 Tax=Streptacidiphilus sp. ASG 303 TaxID=2896847 RepID=UPI001E5E7943|nr:MFS transporter [Streptacidiphilus sp. ASG 303]MCD0485560.1 MFS transporter [Streptacidiphilus sp. ASG 303]